MEVISAWYLLGVKSGLNHAQIVLPQGLRDRAGCNYVTTMTYMGRLSRTTQYVTGAARFRRLLSLLHESRYVEEMMFI